MEQLLDRTLPELRFLTKHNVLTKPEIHDLVQTRRNFEYRLLSTRATRSDYLRYATFEQSHHAKVRRIALTKKLKAKKVSRFLHRLATRPNMIFSRACHKFRGDVDLWLHYIRHCIKSSSKKSASRIFAQALSFNPTSEKLWIAAVSFQYDTLGDSVNARALAQTGLRCLPQCVGLWLVYFQVEIRFLARTRMERVCLDVGIPDGKSFWKGGVPIRVFEKAREVLRDVWKAKDVARFLWSCYDVPFVPKEIGQVIIEAWEKLFGDCLEWRFSFISSWEIFSFFHLPFFVGCYFK